MYDKNEPCTLREDGL